MALQNKKLQKTLAQKAEDHTSVSKGTRKESTTLKQGVPNDHSAKHFNGDAPVVGVSIGSTLNMENYESLRCDVWLTDTVKPGETVEQAYARVVKTVDDTLQKVIDQYMPS